MPDTVRAVLVFLFLRERKAISSEDNFRSHQSTEMPSSSARSSTLELERARAFSPSSIPTGGSGYNGFPKRLHNL
jgi:hypothetical protein